MRWFDFARRGLRAESARSIEQWDASRKQSVPGVDRVFSLFEQIKALLDTQHWLTPICFIEGVDPRSLILPERVCQKVSDELETLAGFSPFDVYAAALQRMVSLELDSSKSCELVNAEGC